MKKRLARARNHSRRVHHHTASQHEAVFVLRRIVVLTACLGLFIFVFALFNRQAFDQAVAGATITRGLFVQTTVPLPNIPGAAAYNLYYKQPSNATYVNAVHTIPPMATSYTVSYLRKGASYQYRISAINASGAEYWWSPVKWFYNFESM